MDSVTGVDVALLPVSGVYVMTAQEAAEAARRIQPRVAVPMHWGEHIGDEGARLRARAGGRPDPGAQRVTDAERQRTTLRRVAADDPELAARLMLMTLPAAAAGSRDARLRSRARRARRLARVGVGWPRPGRPVAGQAETDFRLAADPLSFVELVTGDAHPLGQLLRGGCA